MMNSIFNCFHAGVNLLAACFGTPTKPTTTMDDTHDQEIIQPIELAGDQQETSDPAALLVQHHPLQESMHEGKHDTRCDLSKITEQSFVPNAVNDIPQSICSGLQTNITCSHKHTSSLVSIHTLNSTHTQDPLYQNEPVAQRTRSKIMRNRDLHSPPPPEVSSLSPGNIDNCPRGTYKFQRRATQRWCKLLTATESRLAKNGLKVALGSHWPVFVQHAKDHYWPKWKKLFSSTMKCNGPLDGESCCPSLLAVDPTCKHDLALMHLLHLDHAYPLHTICRAWLRIIKSQPAPLTSWDQGIDGDLVCQLLFGVENHPNLHTTENHLWRANVRFRCYLNNGEGCHDVHGYANAHLNIQTTDLAR